MKLSLTLATTVAVVATSAAAAPLFSPLALTVSSDGSLVPLPAQAMHKQPCHGGGSQPGRLGAPSFGGLKGWLASALGRSRAALADVHHLRLGDAGHDGAASWGVIRLKSDALTSPVVTASASEGAVHGRPGFASVEDARAAHEAARLEHQSQEHHAGGRHHLQAGSLARFHEALGELTLGEGLFVSFTSGAGVGALAGILFKIARLLFLRRRARRENADGSSSGCGRRSRKCRRAARVAAREPVAGEQQQDEKAGLIEHAEAAQDAGLPAYRDVERTPAAAARTD